MLGLLWCSNTEKFRGKCDIYMSTRCRHWECFLLFFFLKKKKKSFERLTSFQAKIPGLMFWKNAFFDWVAYLISLFCSFFSRRKENINQLHKFSFLEETFSIISLKDCSILSNSVHPLPPNLQKENESILRVVMTILSFKTWRENLALISSVL